MLRFTDDTTDGTLISICVSAVDGTMDHRVTGTPNGMVGGRPGCTMSRTTDNTTSIIKDGTVYDIVIVL